MSQTTSAILELIRACAAGDPEARRRFQEEHGEDIYNFPVKLYGLPPEKAGDFYVYVFESDRIFTRLHTFAGRNNIQFRTFLSYYVLKSLFFEWQRGLKKEVETVSLSTPVTGSGEHESVLEDLLPDPKAVDPAEQIESKDEDAARGTWQHLSSEEQLDLKLLWLIEYDFSPDDVRLLATISGRSIRDTLLLLTEAREGLLSKDEKISQMRDRLDSVSGWIRLRQTELKEIDEKIRLLMAGREGQDVLLARREALERALTKRYGQREKIVEEIRKYKLTTPYKDIARLLNTTVGTVCSRIFRLRERLVGEFGERRAREERAQ
jgi:RNA polymerase sigma factor (sigma-70 family)